MRGEDTSAPGRFAATPAKSLPFIRAPAHETGEGLRAGLSAPVTPQALLTAAGEAHRAYERHWDYVRRLHVVPPACRPGCAHCCRLTVEASGPDAGGARPRRHPVRPAGERPVRRPRRPAPGLPVVEQPRRRGL